MKKKTSTEDCAFCIGSKQASDCEVTQELILNHTKKKCDYGNGVNESLRTLVKKDAGTWLPTLKVNVKTVEVEKKAEECN